MATQDLYEEWETRTKAAGRTEGLMASLVGLHKARFGPLPEALRAALAGKVTLETIEPWLALFMTASSPEEIAAAIRKGAPSR